MTVTELTKLVRFSMFWGQAKKTNSTMKQLLCVLSFILLTQQSPGQPPEVRRVFPSADFHDFCLPPFVYTNGDGYVFPLHKERKDEVKLLAIPSRGYVFIGWQRVDVFTFTEYTYNGADQPNPPVYSTVLSPIPGYDQQPVLRYAPLPETPLYDDPGVISIVQDEGWIANFVPRGSEKKPKDK